MKLCGAGLAFSRSGEPCPFTRFRRNRSRVGGRRSGSAAAWAFNRGRENFALSFKPIDVRLALGLTTGDPKVVGTFANGLFQIWHGILFFHDAPSPAAKVLLP